MVSLGATSPEEHPEVASVRLILARSWGKSHVAFVLMFPILKDGFETEDLYRPVVLLYFMLCCFTDCACWGSAGRRDATSVKEAWACFSCQGWRQHLQAEAALLEYSIEARDTSVLFSAKRIGAERCASFESCFEFDQYQYQFAIGIHHLQLTIWMLTCALHVSPFLPLPH